MAKKKTQDETPTEEPELAAEPHLLEPLLALASIVEVHSLESSYYIGAAVGHLLAYGRTAEKSELRRARLLIDRELRRLGESDADAD